uniref:WGS project CBMI000000000 data, contig CS3069_c000978 n=1 Tax=Fusarium clavum TaxID=2594811 RepID=A0A090N5D7_9HYPO|nr:unnamed protein product [Fusarium clavum]
MLHNRPEGFLKVGHVLFEYMVDRAIWNQITKRRKALGIPVIEWPWTGDPKNSDESMGISATYHEWRKGNGHELPQDFATRAQQFISESTDLDYHVIFHNMPQRARARARRERLERTLVYTDEQVARLERPRSTEQNEDSPESN